MNLSVFLIFVLLSLFCPSASSQSTLDASSFDYYFDFEDPYALFNKKDLAGSPIVLSGGATLAGNIFRCDVLTGSLLVNLYAPFHPRAYCAQLSGTAQMSLPIVQSTAGGDFILIMAVAPTLLGTNLLLQTSSLTLEITTILVLSTMTLTVKGRSASFLVPTLSITEPFLMVYLELKSGVFTFGSSLDGLVFTSATLNCPGGCLPSLAETTWNVKPGSQSLVTFIGFKNGGLSIPDFTQASMIYHGGVSLSVKNSPVDLGSGHQAAILPSSYAIFYLWYNPSSGEMQGAIFSGYTSWSSITSPPLVHGDGFTVTLLCDVDVDGWPFDYFCDPLVAVVGGSLNGNLLQIYNATSDSWTTGSSLVLSRTYHRALFASNLGGLLIAGTNQTNSGQFLEVYSLLTNSWSTGPNQVYTHNEGMALSLFRSPNSGACDGKYILSGGSPDSPTLSEELNLSSGRDVATAGGPLFPLVYSGNGVEIECAAQILYGGNEAGTNAFQAYDCATNRFVSKTSVNGMVLSNTAQVLHCDGAIGVYGSRIAGSQGLMSLYSNAANNWILAPIALQQNRVDASAILLRDCSIVIVGGSQSPSTAERFYPGNSLSLFGLLFNDQPCYTRSITPTTSASHSSTPSNTPTMSITPSRTPTLSKSSLMTITPKASPSISVSSASSISPSVSVISTTSPTLTVSPSISSSLSISVSISLTAAVTVSVSPSLTVSPSLSSSISPSQSSTISGSKTVTGSPSSSVSPSHSSSASVAPSSSASVSVSLSPSSSLTVSPSLSGSLTVSPSISTSSSPSASISLTSSHSLSSTISLSGSVTVSPSFSSSSSQSKSATLTASPSLSSTISRSSSQSPSITASPSSTLSKSVTVSPSLSNTAVSTPTSTVSQSFTQTKSGSSSPSATPSSIQTNTPTASSTLSNSQTPSSFPSSSPTKSRTASFSPSSIASSSPSTSSAPSNSAATSPTGTISASLTASVSQGASASKTPSNLASKSPSSFPSRSNTPSVTGSHTSSSTQSPTSSSQRTPTLTPSKTISGSETMSITSTPSNTVTRTATASHSIFPRTPNPTDLPSSTPSKSFSVSKSFSATISFSPSQTISQSETPSASFVFPFNQPSQQSTRSQEATASPSHSSHFTPLPSRSRSRSLSSTPTSTVSQSPSHSFSSIHTPSPLNLSSSVVQTKTPSKNPSASTTQSKSHSSSITPLIRESLSTSSTITPSYTPTSSNSPLHSVSQTVSMTISVSQSNVLISVSSSISPFQKKPSSSSRPASVTATVTPSNTPLPTVTNKKANSPSLTTSHTVANGNGGSSSIHPSGSSPVLGSITRSGTITPLFYPSGFLLPSHSSSAGIPQGSPASSTPPILESGPFACLAASDCNDNNPCTLDKCINGQCRNNAVEDRTACGLPDNLHCNEMTCFSGKCIPFSYCGNCERCSFGLCLPITGCKNDAVSSPSLQLLAPESRSPSPTINNLPSPEAASSSKNNGGNGNGNGNGFNSGTVSSPSLTNTLQGALNLSNLSQTERVKVQNHGNNNHDGAIIGGVLGGSALLFIAISFCFCCCCIFLLAAIVVAKRKRESEDSSA